MPDRCIVSTRPDGGVSITYPSAEFMAFFTLGGAPYGYFGRIDWDGQIASMTGRGIRESVAVQWVRSIINGGLTTAEAYELIRDRDTAPEWTGKELWDRADVPRDRWFRNAWYRSHNGGPICVDLGRAKSIQFREIKNAVDCENKRRKSEIDLFDIPVACDLAFFRERVRKASDEFELRCVWPKGLPWNPCRSSA
jgi:hypothetical protein